MPYPKNKTLDHGKSINDLDQYEALRRKGYGKEKAACIANDASRSQTGKKGGRGSKHEDRSKSELQRKAKKVGIEGRSDLDKDALIDALRNH